MSKAIDAEIARLEHTLVTGKVGGEDVIDGYERLCRMTIRLLQSLRPAVAAEIEEARREEREACAALAAEYAQLEDVDTTAAIRARGAFDVGEGK